MFQSLAIQTANGSGCRVIVANDPDADRLAVAEKQPDESWKVFSGNELGWFACFKLVFNLIRFISFTEREEM